jgi:nitrogen fixation NifU-like protein
MMDELSDLYQEVILDHSRHPRNTGRVAGANRRAEGYNPLCGDRFTLYLKVDDDVVIDASFEGTGCAISTASASMLTEFVKGKMQAELGEAFKRFIALATAPPDAEVDASGLGKLAAFAGVREYPVRVKCATLAWHTLQAALKNSPTAVTTE